jgi:hypothetical protein
MGCRLTFHVDAQCENHLGRPLFTYSLQKLRNTELLGTYPFKWRKPSTKCMITPSEDACPFERKNIRG